MISLPKLTAVGLVVITTIIPFAFGGGVIMPRSIERNEAIILAEKQKLDEERAKLKLMINDTIQVY